MFSRSRNTVSLTNLSAETKNEDFGNSSIVSLSKSIIIQAISSEASDIHIEPNCENVKIRFRIDGMLYEYMEFSAEIYPMVCARFKILAGMDVTEKRKPQDGKILFNYCDNDYDCRAATIPTIYGEKIVIRILSNNKKKISLQELGFDDAGIENIAEMLNRPYGIILVTGPTGSGKSTTIYSMINLIDKSRKNIMTIEDPVEYSIDGVNQVNICNKTGLTFANGLRSILRQDPDVLMVGEIRDEETAEIAVRAAITGHLVLSTLHTNDSTSSLMRLVDMGIPNYLASDAVTGIIAQRLVRKICMFCREESFIDMKTLHIPSLEAEGKIKVYKGKGCSKCNYTGYRGRTVVYECNKIDEKKRIIIQNSKTVEEMRKHNFESGMRTLAENCLDLVKNGITTIEELNRVISNQ